MKHIVEEVVLSNGSRGLLIHVPNATVMAYDFEFRAGHDYSLSRDLYETPHIMEHMVFGANEKYKSAREFNSLLIQNGAYSNATTDSVSLHYVGECADFEWQRVLELMRLAITKPLFLQDEFKAEFGNVREERTGRLNNNGMILWQLIGQVSGERLLTEEQVIAGMHNVKLKDIKEHFERTHTSDNMRFVIAGNLLDERKAKLISMLEEWTLPRGERFSLIRDELVGAMEPVRIYRKDVDNLIFGLSMQANWRLPDDEMLAMTALNHILTGAHYSSYIFGRARSAGLVYSVSSDLARGDGTTEWCFGGQVSFKNAKKLFSVIIEELNRVLKGEIKQADVEAAKSFMLGKYQMSCQTVSAVAGWYAYRYYFDGYVYDYADRPNKIAALEKGTMVKVAEELMGGKRWTFGGLGNIDEKDLKELHTQLGTLFE